MAIARSLGIAAVGLGALLALTSCASDPRQGYSFKTTFDTETRTVQVPIFRNNTYFHGVEAQLTEAIIKEIQSKTPWIIDPSPAADTTLSGTITNVELKRTATDPSGFVQEYGYVITVNFDWVDNATGKTLASRRSFSAADTFVPVRGVSEKIEYGQASAAQRLAKDVVSEMRTQW
ncbi:MAG: hypothetical protein K2Y21_04525 [Phycisphaerales bacterium]|nr:hypothetical protein [Phycisphaerales bacterium]